MVCYNYDEYIEQNWYCSIKQVPGIDAKIDVLFHHIPEILITFTSLSIIIYLAKYLSFRRGVYYEKKLRHDRHTVSLLTDHMVFSPKYRGEILNGEVAMVAEAIIRKTCVKLDIEIIDLAVNPDHVHIFIKYPPKYSVSYMAKMIKCRTSRLLKQEFPELKE